MEGTEFFSHYVNVRALANRDNYIDNTNCDNQITIMNALIVCIDMAFQQLLKLELIQTLILYKM